MHFLIEDSLRLNFNCIETWKLVLVQNRKQKNNLEKTLRTRYPVIGDNVETH